MWGRIAAGIVGTLAVLAGLGAYGYAIMASDDFHNPDVSLSMAIVVAGIMWVLTLGAFGMGVHFLKYCLTGRFFRINPWVRALILGVLSFFPGFIMSVAPAIFLVSRQWPRSIRAENIAMLISAFGGLACAVVVSIALVRRVQRNDAEPAAR